MKKIDFNVNPKSYKHWKIEIEENICNLIFNVDEDKGLIGDYKLKLNSYDLGVDIELYDVLQRLRFEYPFVNLIIIKRDIIYAEEPINEFVKKVIDKLAY